MNRAFFQLLLIQFREFYREPAIIFWSIIFPILMSWGLGLAFTQEGDETHNIALVGMESPVHPLLRSFLFNSQKNLAKGETMMVYEHKVTDKRMGNVVYRFYICFWDDAILMLKRGKVQLILKDHPDKLSYHFDPANAEGKLAYLQLSTALNHDQIRDETGVVKPLKVVGTRYIDFLVPGLIAMGVMSAIMWGISYDLIDKRAKKLLRRMIATPMKRSELLLSHFVARLLLSLVESMLIYLFANFYFGITVTGSWLALLMVMLAGNICFTGVAIFISSRTARTEIGNGLINAVTMPMMVLSGIFFSYHHFPEGAIPFIQALPLTMLADSLRSIFLEGAGFVQVIIPTAILTGIGVSFFGIGLKMYKWH